MKRTTRRIFTTVSALSILTSQVCAQDTAPTSVPVLPDTYGTVVIGNLPGLLDKAGELASQVMPSFNNDMLRQQFGAMVGDPELKGLPSGSGIAVVVPRSGLPFAFLEVSADKIGDYEKLMKQRGVQSAAQVDGLLVGAANDASLDAAKRFAAGVKSQVLQGDGQPTLSASVKLAEVLKQYEPQMQGMLKNFSAKMEQATTATPQLKSAETMMRVYYALGKKIDLFEMAFAPSAKGVSMDYHVTPLGGGSSPAKVAEAVNGAAMLKLIPGTGALRAEWSYDPKWIAGPFMQTFVDAMKESGVKLEKQDELMQWMQTSMASMAGGMGMGFLGDAESPMNSAYAMSVTHEAGALQFLKDMESKLESTGLSEFYKGLGIPMTITFKENTGEHAGVKIHQLTTKMDLAQMPEADQARMAKLTNVTYDVAIANKVLLYAVAPTKIQDLIDAAKAGAHPDAKPLVSKTNLPSNGSFYGDYNLGAMFGFAEAASGVSSEQATALKKMGESLKGTSPVQIGGYSEGGKHRMLILVPAETIKAFTQMKSSDASAAQETEAPAKSE